STEARTFAERAARGAFVALGACIPYQRRRPRICFGVTALSTEVFMGASFARVEYSAMNDAPVAELLAGAADGDQSAWNALVEKYNRLVWYVVRGFRLDDAAAADVTQTVWLKLVEHCGRIRDPERLAGWLAVTARNEALRVLKQQGKQTPSNFEFDIGDPTAVDLDERLVDDEIERAALRACSRLPAHGQRLPRLLCDDPLSPPRRSPR